MKATIAGLALAGVALVALRRSAPAVTAAAEKKCMQMFERHTGGGPATSPTGCSPADCGGPQQSDGCSSPESSLAPSNL